tara:strand:+ start:778 stop:972 length:195 start_codon:yes stop_codon:yes gene_type:complete
VNKYEIGDIVNVHSYDLRFIGKITKTITDNYGVRIVTLISKDGQYFEVCEQDITIKLGEDNGNN